MERKRKPLTQLTLDEVIHGKKSKDSSQNVYSFDSSGCVEPIAGTVKRMVLKNFMCHSHLEVTFNHNINYVIGSNGSGKSAILTGLVVGLGGKASLTNRGNSIKSFIKTGKNSASVEITLRNHGYMAYRNDIYDNEITIIRNFTGSGASSYKVKSATGGIISTQPKEIQRICTSLNIQIDNPICLLNQDTSRNFLNSKDPQQKFLLFMRATHLQDILDEYKKIRYNQTDAVRMLHEKNVLYQSLAEELEQLKTQVKNFKSINKLKDRVNYLQREMYWAKVNDSEQDMELQQQVVDQLGQELASVQDQITDHTNKSAKIEERIQALQQQVYDLQESIEFQNGPQNAHVRALGELKDTYNSKRRERRVVLKDIAVKTGNYSILQQEIDSIRANFAQIEEEKVQRLQEISNIEEKLRGVEGLLETSKNDQFQIRNSLEHLQEEDYNLQSELQQINAQIDNTVSRHNSFKGEGGNILSLYGRDMPKIIEAINAVKQKFKHLPRGPLGSYITLKDKKWAVAVEGFFGAGLLRAFAVDNKKDNEILMSIFQRLWSGGGKPMVITSKFFFEIHDVRPNIVHPVGTCTSIYSALEISDPVVANCLIDQTSLESVLLVPDTDTAIELMSEKRRVPKNCKQGITMKGDKYYPDPNYKTYGSRYHTAQFLQVSTADIIKQLDQKLQDLNSNKNTIMQRHQTIKSELEEHTKRMKELEVKVTKLHRAQLHLRRQYDDLTNAAEPDVANVHMLENEQSELKQAIEHRKIEEQKIEEDVKEIQKKIEESERELERYKTVCRGYEDRIEPLQQQISDDTTVSKQCQTNKRFATKRLQEYENKVKNARNELTSRAEMVQRNTNQAIAMGPRLGSERNVIVIVEEINTTQRLITQIESEVESVDDLMKKYHTTKEKYTKASDFMLNMTKDIDELRIATEKHSRYYKHSEEYFTSYVKHSFQKVLELRQFQGNIEIDMKSRKLDLIVIPQQGSQGYTTTSNLSGGERSFSTVAFLYSLWQCMDFPFYFLDEFDVFMDKVNRTKVMEVLLQHAKSCPDLQFVFLTPQDVSFVHDKAVTIHRLEDPERSVATTN